MAQRRRFLAEYKHEAVAMLNAPGLTVSQIATELGVGASDEEAGFFKACGALLPSANTWSTPPI